MEGPVLRHFRRSRLPAALLVVLAATACGGAEAETLGRQPTKSSLIEAIHDHDRASHEGDLDLSYAYLSAECRARYDKSEWTRIMVMGFQGSLTFRGLDWDEVSYGPVLFDEFVAGTSSFAKVTLVRNVDDVEVYDRDLLELDRWIFEGERWRYDDCDDS